MRKDITPKRKNQLCRYFDKSAREHTCTITASFGYVEEGKRLFCSKHKEKGMVSLGNKKCLECLRIARYNYPDENCKLYCSDHKKENMVISNAKICIHEKCLKCARWGWYNTVNESVDEPLYCIKHKLAGMSCIKTKVNNFITPPNPADFQTFQDFQGIQISQTFQGFQTSQGFDYITPTLEEETLYDFLDKKLE